MSEGHTWCVGWFDVVFVGGQPLRPSGSSVVEMPCAGWFPIGRAVQIIYVKFTHHGNMGLSRLPDSGKTARTPTMENLEYCSGQRSLDIYYTVGPREFANR